MPSPFNAPEFVLIFFDVLIFPIDTWIMIATNGMATSFVADNASNTQKVITLSANSKFVL